MSEETDRVLDGFRPEGLWLRGQRWPGRHNARPTLVVATDATVRAAVRAAAWLDSDGRWWAASDAAPTEPGTQQFGHRVLRAECRAVLRGIIDHPRPRPFEVWSDSLAAVALCRRWAAGQTPRPRRWMDDQAIRRLAREVAERHPDIYYRHVPGHSDVAMNMGAHAIADSVADGLAARRSTEQVRGHCNRLAFTWSRRHRDTVAASA